ncbi:hypothetical protein E2605_06560 [Dysgonomonas capnocytophagoides]|uniref:Uncharacterized protein n=1 Tax=Dysgonomonas capnocytophagoides TaxID=45254 RepID=A0A4Y8L3T9_9BACT|nr:hypothetical protein [Dysgonomonas capnocytophagoides]TFD97325.1 hypothetical protein E2605_06560 [Dysgonomonas capnocytophagoides]
MENKPINNEAFGYVRLNVAEKVNLDDFIIIEKFVCELHNSFLPDGIYGDGDLRKFVHEKLKENSSNIPYNHVDNIVNALFDFLFDNDTLLPIILFVKLENWKDWEQVLQKSVRDFISSYDYAPNILSMSSYTKSQIELVSGMQSISSLSFIKTIEKETDICHLKFYLDDDLLDKNMILKYIPRNDDNDDEFASRELPIDIITIVTV